MFGFVDLFAGGRSTAAVVTLDTVAEESRKMADGVARSPSRLCSRDGKICCYGDALSTIFLLAFVPCFLLFVFHFSFLSFLIFFPCIPECLSSSCPFVCAAAICFCTCSFCLCHLHPTPSRNSFVLYSFRIFFVALISRVAFFLLCSRTRYPST